MRAGARRLRIEQGGGGLGLQAVRHGGHRGHLHQDVLASSARAERTCAASSATGMGTGATRRCRQTPPRAHGLGESDIERLRERTNLIMSNNV